MTFRRALGGALEKRKECKRPRATSRGAASGGYNERVVGSEARRIQSQVGGVAKMGVG